MAIDYVEDLRSTVIGAAERLQGVSDCIAARRADEAKWSCKEIIGHLVDSAANNHQRFVRAQFQEDLIFAGYAQVEWVGAQNYQEAPWANLVLLWREFNLHLAHVIESMPSTERTRLRHRHNLDEIAWKPVSANEPTTLDYFMRDYVDHLHHHLRQVEALLRLHAEEV